MIPLWTCSPGVCWWSSGIRTNGQRNSAPSRPRPTQKPIVVLAIVSFCHWWIFSQIALVRVWTELLGSGSVERFGKGSTTSRSACGAGAWGLESKARARTCQSETWGATSEFKSHLNETSCWPESVYRFCWTWVSARAFHWGIIMGTLLHLCKLLVSLAQVKHCWLSL